MNLYRLKISGSPFDDSVSYSDAQMNGFDPYVAALSNPSPADFDDITSIENWDSYGEKTALSTKQVRDELSALFVSWASSSANEKEIFSRWFIADKSDRDSIHSAQQQEENSKRLVNFLFFSSSNDLISQESSFIASADKNDIDSRVSQIDMTSGWTPPDVNLGDGSIIGVTTFINDNNIGKYYAFDAASDDIMSFNWDLRSNSMTYDGSEIALNLFARIATNGAGSDDVGIVLEYAFYKAGDDTSTGGTVISQQSIDVSTKTANEGFNTLLNSMSGPVGSTNLMITITRNSSGTGQDSYSDQFELLGIKLVKV